MTAEVRPLPIEEIRENPLSEREMDVARQLATGASNSEIARNLQISPHTVKVHLRNIFDKLQVNSRTEASILLVQRGWLVIPGLESEPAEPLPAAAPIPDPLPLADLSAVPAFWQRLYLAAVALLCLSALLIPAMLGRTAVGSGLLGDGGNTQVSKPIVQLPTRWELRTPLLQPRSRMAVARVGDRIFVIGGEGAKGEQLASVDAYDLRFNRWEPLASLPRPVANAAAAVLDDRIYLAGGSMNQGPEGDESAHEQTVSNVLWRYSTADDSWQEVGTLPVPLAGAALVAARGALYLIGGWDGEKMHAEMWRLAPDDDANAPLPNWEVLGQQLGTARAFLGAALLNDKIYVVGGYDGERELNLASAYDLASQEWSTLPPLSTARGGLTLVASEQSIFALGGGWTQAIDSHERFDLAFNLWSTFPSPVVGEWRNLVAVSEEEGSISLIGGWSGDYLDLHVTYDSSLRSLLLPLIRRD